MSDLKKLKESIEAVALIHKWNPTPIQLLKIAKNISVSGADGKDDLEKIVAVVCPDASFTALEGIDNSDLRTLVALAIKVASAKG